MAIDRACGEGGDHCRVVWATVGRQSHHAQPSVGPVALVLLGQARGLALFVHRHERRKKRYAIYSICYVAGFHRRRIKKVSGSRILDLVIGLRRLDTNLFSHLAVQ
jgi:hypothetical protein